MAENRNTFLLLLIVAAIAVTFSSCVAPVGPVAVSVKPHSIGYGVAKLPVGHRAVWIAGKPYHVHSNRYYSYRNGRYVVIKRPLGSIRYAAPKRIVHPISHWHRRHHRKHH